MRPFLARLGSLAPLLVMVSLACRHTTPEPSTPREAASADAPPALGPVASAFPGTAAPDVSGARSPGVSSTASTDAGPVDDATFCAPRAGDYPGVTCRWRTTMLSCAWGPYVPPTRQCICDACNVDADCAGAAAVQSRCVQLPPLGVTCSGDHAARACVAPSDPCYPPGRCPKSDETCVTSRGKAICGRTPRPGA
jgi:hypothetical protein